MSDNRNILLSSLGKQHQLEFDLINTELTFYCSFSAKKNLTEYWLITLISFYLFSKSSKFNV